MEVLKVVDTEAKGADPLRELYIFGNIINSTGFTITDENIIFTSENNIPVKNSRVELELGSITNDRVNEIVEQINGLSVLSHRTSITTPGIDGDENTFNYNNYTSDAFSYYNIRNDEYEDYTQTNNEKILPNFCLGAAWARLGETPEQENYYTMFGAIPTLREADVLAGATPINNYEFDDEFLAYGEGAEEKMDYFKVMLANGDIPRTTYQNANTHVYVDFNYNLNDSGQIGNTPFFNRIRLPVVDVPVDNVRDNQNLNTFSRMVKVFEESGMTDRLIKSFRNSNSFMRSFDINGATSDLKVYDVVELFENIGYIGSLTDSDEMYLRSAGQNYARDDNSPFTFYFYKLLLLGKLRNVIKNRLLSFKDIVVDNIDHMKEHVGFKVIKRIQGRDTPIQTFYFLNRRGLEDFIDTQVKFDRVYNYEVIAMYAVYGSNYTYENVELNDYTLSFDFVNRPSVKIVEVPFASHTLRIVEPPPLVPEITFYNEMTSRNKLKIRMEHQDGNFVDEFNPKQMRPFAGNEVYIEKLTQYFNSVDVLITSGKTSDGVYEIYRLEEPPQTYKDFEGALIATVQSNTIFSNGEASRNVMFTDLIKHQKKYYYAFRVLTHRGNPSELSPIYVAEMYEDADETFLTFDLYLEPEVRDYQNVYNMRKYIQILPNFEQTIPNEQELLNTYATADDAIGDIKLGNPDLQETIWDYNNKDRYIKLRLESKSSGRKTDLNLYFKIKKPTN
jgi:hypothetical protein